MEEVQQPQSVEEVSQPQSEYAGFWIRFVAYVIDGLILNFIAFVLVMPLLGLLGIVGGGMEEMGTMDEASELAALGFLAGLGTAMYATLFLLNWLYFALMHSGSWQATLGKRAVGVKVTGINGERITFVTASLRYVGKIISGAIMMIGFIMAGFTAKKQALHDLIASTYVVKSK